MKEPDNYILRLSGKSELPSEIEIGFNYHISLEGAITSKTITDNENGSNSVTYLFKPIKIELLDPKGKTLKLKDTRSASQLLRGSLYKNWLNSKAGQTFDDYYQNGMIKMLQDKDAIAGMYFD